MEFENRWIKPLCLRSVMVRLPEARGFVLTMKSIRVNGVFRSTLPQPWRAVHGARLAIFGRATTVFINKGASE
jgi:hypothetical protein